MKRIFTTLALASMAATAMAQTQLANGGFENWGGNPSPGVASEPTGYYSNKSGSSTAQIGPQTCFKDTLIKHGGNASVRIESATVLGTVVNGNLTTGVINAPTLSKADGYIGTVNYSTATDIRRTAFTGRPDSLVGWYQYTQGGATEKGKVKAILHTGNYYDPEAMTAYHPDAAPNRIGVAEFVTPAANASLWTRFSVPFNYNASTAGAYIMLNATSSNDQLTTVAGSKLWLDDIAVVYNSASNVPTVTSLGDNAKVYCSGKTVYTDFLVRNNDRFTLQIIDIVGRPVASQKLTANGLNTLDVSMLSAGIYTYRILGNNAQTAGRISVQ